MCKKKLYSITLCVLSLFSIDMQAMDLIQGKQELIPIELPVVENATQAPALELLDLNKEERLKKHHFSALMKKKHDLECSYIIARVVTVVSDKSTVDYFDGEKFNKVLFGGYPLHYLKSLNFYTHLYSGLPLQAVDYYGCAPDGKSFTFICSYQTLLDEQRRATIFRFFSHKLQICQDNQEARADALIHYGYHYYQGSAVQQNFERALFFFEKSQKVAESNGYVRAASDACRWQGHTYVSAGVDSPCDALRNYQKAVARYQQAIAFASRAIESSFCGNESARGLALKHSAEGFLDKVLAKIERLNRTSMQSPKHDSNEGS